MKLLILVLLVVSILLIKFGMGQDGAARGAREEAASPRISAEQKKAECAKVDKAMDNLIKGGLLMKISEKSDVIDVSRTWYDIPRDKKLIFMASISLCYSGDDVTVRDGYSGKMVGYYDPISGGRIYE